MKILMFFPGHIEHLPPLITAAKTMADLGASINVVAISSNHYIQNYFKKNNITLSILDYVHPQNKIKRGLNKFKIMSLLVKEKNLFKPDYLWFHGPFSCKYSFILKYIYNTRFIYHAYELCSKEKLLKLMHYFLISNSELVIVPEQNRLNILSKKFNNVLFSYIPNIPANNILTNMESVDIKEIFRNNGGSDCCTKFLIYQGAFMKDRCLIEIIEAFKLIDKNNVGLILMGANRTSDIYNKLKEAINDDNRIIVLPRIEYPCHLSITRDCIGGFLLYRPNKINNLYCAPNKIYEYTSLGLGVIYSDSPGLNYLKTYSIGYSCNPIDPLSIKDAIQKLLNRDKTELYNKSINFYNQVPTPSYYYYPLFKKLNVIKNE